MNYMQRFLKYAEVSFECSSNGSYSEMFLNIQDRKISFFSRTVSILDVRLEDRELSNPIDFAVGGLLDL